MEGVSGSSSAPPDRSSDKSRVLDVKPLRTLVPMFPDPPNAPPFLSSTPFGPFPTGFTPFYPFSGMQRNQTSGEVQQQGATTPVPPRAVGTPQTGTGFHLFGASNGGTGSSMEGSRVINFGEGVTGGKKRAT